MGHQSNFHHILNQSSDRTWVLNLPVGSFNGYSSTFALSNHVSQKLSIGCLVRVLLSDSENAQHNLWRVVAKNRVTNLHSSMDQVVLVPSNIPSSVPASSVMRVENAVKGHRWSECQAEEPRYAA